MLYQSFVGAIIDLIWVETRPYRMNGWDILLNQPKCVKRSACLWDIYSFILNCVLQYLSLFWLKTYDNFIPLNIRDTIGHTSLQPNNTNPPLTYHIRVPSLELYLHRITFYIFCHWFVPQNEILHCRCNIGTATDMV